MRIKDMITNIRSFDHQMDSSFQNQKKHVEKSVKKIDTDVRV